MTKRFALSKEILLYLVFGVLTTLINIAVYYLFATILEFGTFVSNATAWFLSVMFAYVTNRYFVFSQHADGFKAAILECSKFYSGRIFTGVMDMVLMVFLVDVCHYDDFMIKVIVNIIVVVLNYIISKLLIFRKKEVEE